MQPVKALNNNVLLARDPTTGQEVILVGRGLGFAAGGPLALDDPRVEKVFRLDEGQIRRGFLQLVETTDAAVVGLAQEILQLAADRFGPLHGEAHLTLAEHLAASLDRVQQQLTLPNPFLPEIELLYPEEYALAGEAVALVKARLGLALPEEEQGVLALHLLGARLRKPPKAVARHTAVIREAADWFTAEAGLQRDHGDPRLARLLSHLRLAVDLIAAGRTEPNPLLGRIQSEYPEAFGRCRRLGDLMAERLGQPVGDDEVGYLALHFLRLTGVSS